MDIKKYLQNQLTKETGIETTTTDIKDLLETLLTLPMSKLKELSNNSELPPTIKTLIIDLIEDYKEGRIKTINNLLDILLDTTYLSK